MTEYVGNAGRQTGTSEINRLQFVISQMMNRNVTATIVLVKAVNGDTVDVQPMVAQLEGGGKTRPHGTINNLPVWRLQGGGNAVIIDPVAGDIGLAIFCHSDISSVKKSKAPGPPGSRRRFDWSDGIYLGGLLNSPATQFVRIDDEGVTITSTGTVTINTGGSDVTIDAGGGTVTIPGELAVDSLTVDGNPYDQHKHLGVTTGGGTSGIVTT